jgi:D-alanyl-lipoteichoic acid acyltransferase DltB (MBOAT superfamily)
MRAMRSLPTTAPFTKMLVCALGAGLLYSVSQSGWAPCVLLGVSLATFGLGYWLRQHAHTRWLPFATRGAVPCALAFLVLLNLLGAIGTLTGSQSSTHSIVGRALIAMPFYLLSAAAFIVDMAGRKTPLPTGLDFCVYMALPFKLLSGPLEPPRLIEQIRTATFRLRQARMLSAWSWIVLGAFMKYVIANRLDPAKNLIYTDPLRSFATAAVFELKFYFDFAGYSFMAYGAALAVGLRMSQNFNHPFLAPTVVLFWRSWHISLGRFLTKYVLEPNLGLWRNHAQKLVFASSIFLVSAMWHGGTANYVLWGLFHGVVYYSYVRWMKRRDVPAAVGMLSMLLFFVFGRMLAIDANTPRLLQRLHNFFEPTLYTWHSLLPGGSDSYLFSHERNALLLACLFIALEIVNRRVYGSRLGYHIFRRPLAALILLMLFLWFGVDTGVLLYARI